MADLRDMLGKISLFGQVGDDILAGVSAQLHRKTFRKGTIIFHKDQAGDALYIVESGRVRIFLPTQGGAARRPPALGERGHPGGYGYLHDQQGRVSEVPGAGSPTGGGPGGIAQ